MNVIDRHIRYLLRAQGSVAVPGLGVFVSCRNSSSFVGDTLTAPSVLTSFTADEACDGSALVASVERQLGIPEIDATSLIEGEVRQWLHQLSLGVAVEIEGVGLLAADKADGCLKFSSLPSVSASWLTPLDLTPLVVEKEPYQQPDEERDEQRTRLMRSIARTASSAAAIAIMVLIAFIASQLPKSPAISEVQYASLPIEPLSSLSITSKNSDLEHNDHANAALVLILNTPADGIAEVSPAEPITTVDVESRYCLVVASLYSRKEAETFIASVNSDIDLGIVENDGRYRVFASQGPTIDAVKADAKARNLYDRFPSGWICRK